MPWLQRNGYRLYHTQDGDPAAPALVFSHSLGADLSMWDPQVEALENHFRLIRYDHPGHGRSDTIGHSPTIGELGMDALALLDELELESTFFCGLSLGGMVGLWIGANLGGRLRKLVVSSTTARIENTDLLRGRIRTIRTDGLAAISESVIQNWFTPNFSIGHPEAKKQALRMLTRVHSEAYAALAETVCEMDLRDQLARIRIPTLILYGTEDKATPPAWNLALHDKIAGSRVAALNAAHLANIEAAADFTSELRGFLEGAM
jgi:3-oxoadipate enol-lactonase